MKVRALVLSAAFAGLAAPAGAEPATCSDGLMSAGETDLDCGGSCGPCDPGAKCVVARDCTSGVCAEGSCVERSHEPGAAVPAGYVVAPSHADRAATARLGGLLLFGTGYAGAYVSALALPGRLTWMYVPVAGPWGALFAYDHGPTGRAVIAIDGAVQLTGAALLVGGLLGAGEQLVREPESARVQVVPLAGGGGFGLAALGSF